MKTNVIFYAALILLIVGGVKWTSYSIHNSKLEKLNQTNHYVEFTRLINSSGQPGGTVASGKPIVLYHYASFADSSVSLLKEFSKLAAEHPEAQFFAITSDNGDEKKDATAPVITLRNDRTIIQYSGNIASTLAPPEKEQQVTFSRDEIEKMYPIVILVSTDGKVKTCAYGLDEDLLLELEKEL